jgi:hypothetical protein
MSYTTTLKVWQLNITDEDTCSNVMRRRFSKDPDFKWLFCSPFLKAGTTDHETQASFIRHNSADHTGNRHKAEREERKLLIALCTNCLVAHKNRNPKDSR